MNLFRKYKKMLSIVVYSVTTVLYQTASAQSFIDGYNVTGLEKDTGQKPIVYSFDQQADGRMIIGGDFKSVQNNNVISQDVTRLDALGNIDTSFQVTTNGSVRKVVVLPNGKIMIAGFFNNVNSVLTGSVARLNADGTLDSTFNYENVIFTRDMAILDNGKILVAGQHPVSPGNPNFLFRLNPNGTLDSSFKHNEISGANAEVEKIVPLTNGDLIIVGNFTKVGTENRARIAKLNSEGQLVTDSFTDSNVDDRIEDVAVQQNGKVIIGGSFLNVAGVQRKRLARLNVDGSLDTSFTPNSAIDGSVFSVALGPDGLVYVGGQFNTLGISSTNKFGRLLQDGQTDTLFLTTINDQVRSIQTKANGFVYVAGKQNVVGNLASVGFTRLSTLVQPFIKEDTSFVNHPGTDQQVRSIAVVPSANSMWLGGSFNQVGSKVNTYLSRQSNSGDHASFFDTTSETFSGPGINSVAAT
jgi:uncharacterized delta-60 repeat protein